MKNKLEAQKNVVKVPSGLVKDFFEEKWLAAEDEGIESVYKTRNPGVDFLIEQLKHNKDKIKVADLGCGDGRFTMQYVANGFEVMAVDFSRNALARVKQRAKAQNIEQLVHTLEKDIMTIDLAREEYNAVAASNVLHYFSVEQLNKIIMRMKTPL